jgi:MFS family permease
VLFLISMLCVGPPPPGHRKASAGGAGGAGFDVSQVLRATTFWKLAIAGLLFQIAFVGVNTHVVPFASDLGLVDNPGGALGVLLAVGIVGRFGMGMVVDRFGARPVFLTTYSLVGVSLLCVIFSDHIAMFWLFIVLFGISAGGMITVPTLLIARLFGTRAVGQIVGINLLVGTLGAFIGPPVAGRIREVTGSYDLAVIVWTIAVALGLLLATQIPNPDRAKESNGEGP